MLVYLCEVLWCGLGGVEGWVVFIYVIVYIEFNVIDLVWDVVYWFWGLLLVFYVDWVSCVDDELWYFMLLCECL